MTEALLVQLPIPRLDYGRQTGNIPLGAACLKQAATGIPNVQVALLPESVASYLGDAALLELLLSRKPDLVGFSVYSWNLERSLFMARRLKEAYGVKIVLGGPEVTADNSLIASGFVDFRVYGEGEIAFVRLIQDQGFWQNQAAGDCAAHIFASSPSPYLSDLLEPDIENLMMLETQRGCPYRCGYCYYNKSRDRLVFLEEKHVLRGVQWALDHRIRELYLLDPSLNARPGLKFLLKKIARLNKDRRLVIFSEIRAEAIDVELAELFAAAGFNWFEIGLQSTNPRALKLMRRPTDLKKFVRGVTLLQDRGITPGIDLILGLPGDDLDGFRQTVDFVVDHQLQEDVQVFPLSVLPGTEFRRRSRELGLQYTSHAPYTVVETASFSQDDMLLALDYAETRLDVVLYPLPDLDLSFRRTSAAGQTEAGDQMVRIGSRCYLTKLYLDRERSLTEIEEISRRLTNPYQILITPRLRSADYLGRVVETVTRANPFVPFEMVFLEPHAVPDTETMISRARLHKPHYLDGEQRYLFAAPGNRAILFTLVSGNVHRRFNKDMQRQVYWWSRRELPTVSQLAALLDQLDGVLIDCPQSYKVVIDWQDGMVAHSDELPVISFADVLLQRRWLQLVLGDEYYMGAFAE
jgi:Radical SAM superfamily/B12 binding domain